MLRDPGVTLDSSLLFNQHVMNTCRSAFLELRRIGLIRKYITVDATKTVVCSLVLSRFDYCNSILSGSPKDPVPVDGSLVRKCSLSIRLVLAVATPMVCGSDDERSDLAGVYTFKSSDRYFGYAVVNAV